MTSCGPGNTCIDRDFDGYGRGCSLGSDCDDMNAARTNNCAEVPSPDCEATPEATGCPCRVGAVEVCVPDVQVDLGAGVCEPGLRDCLSGFWGLCRDAVLPANEICDGRDQDCDGRIDEGARSPCGGCNELCVGELWEAAELAESPSAAGVLLSTEGALILERTERFLSTLWVPNTQQDSLVGVDAATGDRTRLHQVEFAEPRSVAVDREGDVWVVSHSPGGQGGLTRVAGSLTRCQDRDEDGAIRTWSGEGGAYASEDDECVIASLAVGESGDEPQALAVGWSDVWVSLSEAEKVLRYDRGTAELVEVLDTPGFRGIDAIVDPWGRLWMIAREGGVLRVTPGMAETEVERVTISEECGLLESISVSTDGHLLFTGAACRLVFLGEPGQEEVQVLRMDSASRGALMTLEVGWVSLAEGWIQPMSLSPVPTWQPRIDLHALGAQPVGTTGITTDGLGSLWALSSHDARDPNRPAVLSQISLADGRVRRHVEVGVGAEVRGDWSGRLWRRPFVEEGTVSRITDGCPMQLETEWKSVHIDGDPGATGEGSVSVRHAQEREGLSGASWESLEGADSLSGVYPLRLPEAGVVEVSVQLRRGVYGESPRLWGVGVQWECPGPM